MLRLVDVLLKNKQIKINRSMFSVGITLLESLNIFQFINLVNL